MSDKPSITTVYEALGGDFVGRVGFNGWAKARAICHPDQDPSATINEDDCQYNCWVCGFQCDVYELVQRVEGVTDFSAQKRRAFELAGRSDNPLPAADDGRSARVPGNKGYLNKRRGYVPAWRRS